MCQPVFREESQANIAFYHNFARAINVHPARRQVNQSHIFDRLQEAASKNFRRPGPSSDVQMGKIMVKKLFCAKKATG
jgi:hypothetical protein